MISLGDDAGSARLLRSFKRLKMHYRVLFVARFLRAISRMIRIVGSTDTSSVNGGRRRTHIDNVGTHRYCQLCSLCARK